MKQSTYLDRSGIAFDQHRQWLPDRTDQFPRPPRVKQDKAKEQARFHNEFGGSGCWWCEENPGEKLHHLAGGMKGRSHERFLFCWACKRCHREHVGEDDLGRWLYLKWLFDPEHVDWVMTAVRLGRFLPDLVFE